MALPLGSLARSIVGMAFNLAGEIVVAHVYHQTSAVTYNTATGTPTNTQPTTPTVSVIVGKYSQREIDGQRIRVGDEKLIVKAAELGGIVPTVDDYLIAGSVRRDVVSIELDPTGTVYILQTRKAQA